MQMYKMRLYKYINFDIVNPMTIENAYDFEHEREPDSEEFISINKKRIRKIYDKSDIFTFKVPYTYDLMQKYLYYAGEESIFFEPILNDMSYEVVIVPTVQREYSGSMYRYIEVKVYTQNYYKASVDIPDPPIPPPPPPPPPPQVPWDLRINYLALVDLDAVTNPFSRICYLALAKDEEPFSDINYLALTEESFDYMGIGYLALVKVDEIDMTGISYLALTTDSGNTYKDLGYLALITNTDVVQPFSEIGYLNLTQ